MAESEQPILNVQAVNSGAQGREELAKTLGNIGQEAGATAVQMASEESSSMYINSVANIEQLKKGAQIRTLNNLDNATQIAEQTSDAMGTVARDAYVNSKDRVKLKAYIEGAQDDVDLYAARIQAQQTQRSAAFTHFANFPDQLEAYHTALLHDPQKADQLHDAMLGSLRGLVSLGAITPEQAGSSIKLMQNVVDSAGNYYKLAQMTGGANAEDYHTAHSTPLNSDPNSPDAPINESTGWLVDHYTGDRSLQGVIADISNHMRPNADVFTALKPHEQQQAIEYTMGVQRADGIINSGEPFNRIVNEHAELSQKGSELSYSDQAKRNTLGKYIEELKAGNFPKIMAQTPAGNAIYSDFNSANAAIPNLPISDEQKTQLMLDNKNKFVNQSIAYGQGHHIPSQFIQPIPPTDMAQLQAGFQLNQDPNLVLQTIDQYSKMNRPYVAQAIKDPNQRMVVSALSMVDQNISQIQKMDFVAANQTGRQYLSMAEDKDSKDKSLINRIAANLKPSLSVVNGIYNRGDAQTLQNAMLESTLKYAKYLAIKDGNVGEISGSTMKKYVDQASQIYSNSYRQQSGTNWMANSQQLPQPLSDAQLDILADHVINEGYKYLKNGRGDAEYESSVGRNPLTMVVTPTGDLQAIDGYGKVYYSMPFTSNTLPYAAESKVAREKERKAILQQGYEKQARMELMGAGG